MKNTISGFLYMFFLLMSSSAVSSFPPLEGSVCKVDNVINGQENFFCVTRKKNCACVYYSVRGTGKFSGIGSINYAYKDEGKVVRRVVDTIETVDTSFKQDVYLEYIVGSEHPNIVFVTDASDESGKDFSVRIYTIEKDNSIKKDTFFRIASRPKFEDIDGDGDLEIIYLRQDYDDLHLEPLYWPVVIEVSDTGQFVDSGFKYKKVFVRAYGDYKKIKDRVQSIQKRRELILMEKRYLIIVEQYMSKIDKAL